MHHLAWFPKLSLTPSWVAYNVVVLVAFALAYWAYGFDDDHFYMLSTPSEKHSSNYGHALYYAVLVHTTIGFGEFTPRTDFARALTAAHAAAVWVPMLVGFSAASQ